MGKLVTQASILATFQKLSTAEVLAGITFRSAYALGFEDRGVLSEGKERILFALKQIIIRMYCTDKGL